MKRTDIFIIAGFAVVILWLAHRQKVKRTSPGSGNIPVTPGHPNPVHKH